MNETEARLAAAFADSPDPALLGLTPEELAAVVIRYIQEMRRVAERARADEAERRRALESRYAGQGPRQKEEPQE